MFNRNRSRIRFLALLTLVLILAIPVSAQDTMNEFVIGVSETVVTLDMSVRSPSLAHKQVSYAIYEPLLRLGTDGSINPALAAGWTMSDDKLTIILNLREGVSFHDGSPLDADTVVWNINGARDPEFGDGALADYGRIESVEALDDLTVQVNMSQPDANILPALSAGSDSRALIMSRVAYEALGADEYAFDPSGTGPFKLANWEPGVELVLERYEDYWGESDGNADRVSFRVILDASAATLNYQSGDIHTIFSISAQELPLLEAVPGTVSGAIARGVNVLALNLQRPPFDNIHNRFAVMHAIDAETVINLAYGGLAQPARGITPPNSFAFSEESPPVITRDLDAARAALAAAGNPEGFEFNLSVVSQPFRIQVLEIFQANLAEVGISLIIQANERARHIAALREDTSIAEAGYVQILAHRSSMEGYLEPFAGCTAAIKMVRYCTDEYEALMAELPGLFDSAERAAHVRRMNDLTWSNMIVVPYVYPEIPYVYRGDIIEGFALNGYGLLDWTNFIVVGG